MFSGREVNITLESLCAVILRFVNGLDGSFICKWVITVFVHIWY
jgi:hypothetical protein